MNSLKMDMAGAAAAVIGNCLTVESLPRVTVLCYHSVHPHQDFASATPVQFDAHLSWLKTNTRVIPFRDVFRALHTSPPHRFVAITFDDGYEDNYQYAAPLLAKHGLPATFFATAGLIEGDAAVIERCRALQNSGARSIRPMKWHHLQEMARAGFEIGSHTYSHPNLKSLDCRAAYLELSRSREILEQNVGLPMRTMAYPFGNPGKHVVSRTTELAAEAGYELAAGIFYRAIRASDDPLLIPRFTIAGDSVQRLRAKILGHWDFVGACQERRYLLAG